MQRERFDIADRPAQPLRAERRHGGRRDAEGHVRGVEATSDSLVRATLGSAVAAGAILVLFWLPAEYGIDPTRVGRVTGLTQMGEIKQQLYAEAEAEAEDAAAVPTAPATATIDPELVERLESIEAQLAAVAAVIGADRVLGPPEPSTEPPSDELETAVAAPPATPDPEPAPPLWRDEVSYTLAPAEGVEIKLAMEEGAMAAFEWSANGSVLNYDTHGDGGGEKISYEQGRGMPDQAGTLTAAFAGNHGWFWRNRTEGPVTVTLRTRGEYSELRAP